MDEPREYDDWRKKPDAKGHTVCDSIGDLAHALLNCGQILNCLSHQGSPLLSIALLNNLLD